MIYDKVTGRGRGFSFVTMSSIEDVEFTALQFNEYVSGIVFYSFLVYFKSVRYMRTNGSKVLRLLFDLRLITYVEIVGS